MRTCCRNRQEMEHALEVFSREKLAAECEQLKVLALLRYCLDRTNLELGLSQSATCTCRQ